MSKKSRSCLTRISVLFFILLGLCSLLAVLSVSSNRNLPAEDTSESLSPVDQARLWEALHLKTALGDRLWPGWGSADIPVIVWNRSYEFLTNYDGDPPEGWLKVESSLNGETLYRRAAEDPQNFAVRVGEEWVASIGSKQAADYFLIDAFRDNFPAPIKQIFPYRFLIQPSETQMGGLLHETFHVYQYRNAPARMEAAESFHRLEDEYLASADSFQAEWKKESALLADALEAGRRAEKVELVGRFLETRAARRRNYDLEAELVDYERQLEWEEGTAKYVEVAILKRAAETDGYQALPETEQDADFRGYKEMDSRWSQELMQLRYQTTSGESRLYMTGMALAFLLDDLMPEWKDRYWTDGVFLEDLLRQAVAEH